MLARQPLCFIAGCRVSAADLAAASQSWPLKKVSGSGAKTVLDDIVDLAKSAGLSAHLSALLHWTPAVMERSWAGGA